MQWEYSEFMRVTGRRVAVLWTVGFIFSPILVKPVTGIGISNAESYIYLFRE
jgi:hypothetical protein